MANQVYANSREVSCKAADGKSICAFPDVCLSPPSPPAGPIPIPYPNTGMASDMTDGSKTVKVSDKEVMLKDKSYFKKSTGDEAATKSLGMGVVTHQIQGKVYFTSWSMDVKFEGENVVRHLDLTTHNHASKPGQTPPFPHTDAMSPSTPADCDEVKERFPVESYDEQRKKKGGVYEGKQSHHVIQNAHFQKPRGTTIKEICPGYTEGGAPCIPLGDGTDTNTEHGRVSQMQKSDAKRYRARRTNPTYQEARADAKKQLGAKPEPGRSEDEAECILKEVDKHFEKVCGGTASKQLRSPGQRGTWKPNVAVSGGGVGGIG